MNYFVIYFLLIFLISLFFINNINIIKNILIEEDVKFNIIIGILLIAIILRVFMFYLM